MNRALCCSTVLNYVALLKNYAQCKDVERTRHLHAVLVGNGLLQTDLFIASTLIDTYAKCNSLAIARKVFDNLSIRSVVTWNTLITSYVEQGDAEQALQCLEQMHVSRDSVTFLCALKACIIIDSINEGQKMHIEIVKYGVESELFVGSRLVSMYSKSRMFAEARAVFDILPIRDTIVWNTLIAGYAEDSRCEEALQCFELMQKCKVVADPGSVVSSLKACAIAGDDTKGKEIQMQILKQGLQGELLVNNSLIDMYGKCGLLAEAEDIFNKLLVRDEVSWNVLIAGYVELGCSEKALDRFGQMQKEGICPDKVTYIFVMKACRSIGSRGKAQELHHGIFLMGLDKDIVIGNTMVDMYSKCHSLMEAHHVFVRLSHRTVVSWTALISGYVENGHGEEAIDWYEQMQDDGISAVTGTFACILKACTSTIALEKAKAIHADIVKTQLEGDIFVGNSLIDMYAKCSLHGEAQCVFDKLVVQDEVSWNSLIAGYGEHGYWEEALDKFRQMQYKGISPDDVTFICTLKVCSCIGAIDKGQDIHGMIATRGFETNIFIGNALVDMYAKGGLIHESQGVFDKLLVRSFVSWNALIVAHAQCGDMKKIYDIVGRMHAEDINPNEMTFMSILNACSHGGLVEYGHICFHSMNKGYIIIPTLEHYTCLVDLVGRAGLVDKALVAVEAMPFIPNIVLWQIILGVCQTFGLKEYGGQAFLHAMQLSKHETGAYVCFSNIYEQDNIQDLG